MLQHRTFVFGWIRNCHVDSACLWFWNGWLGSRPNSQVISFSSVWWKKSRSHKSTTLWDCVEWRISQHYFATHIQARIIPCSPEHGQLFSKGPRHSDNQPQYHITLLPLHNRKWKKHAEKTCRSCNLPLHEWKVSVLAAPPPPCSAEGRALPAASSRP